MDCPFKVAVQQIGKYNNKSKTVETFSQQKT